MKQNRNFPVLLFFLNAIFLLIFLPEISAKPQKGNGHQVWTASGGTGIALLGGEFSKDFIFLKNEFRHQPGLAFDFNLGRTVGNHWEPVIRLELFSLFGKSDSPLDFSAVGNHISFKGTLFDSPVEYKTTGTSVSGVIRYYFFKFSNQGVRKLSVNPFAEAGAGINYFSTRLSYSKLPEGAGSKVIFRKGVKKKQPRPSMAQVILGIGVKIGNTDRVHAVFSCDANIADYASYDAVHNYSSNGERIHAKAVIAKIITSVVIPLGTVQKSKIKNSSPEYPWAP